MKIADRLTFRRLVLELWAILVLACIVGFLGPFGTYLKADFVDRAEDWWTLLMGAYLLVRPCIFLLNLIALRTRLPQEPLAFWGVAATSVPLAMIWRTVGQNAYRALHGYAELVPFALLCALAVLVVALWSRRTDERLSSRHEPAPPDPEAQPGVAPSKEEMSGPDAPPLQARLSRSFEGPIIALQSEDHYVRVHGSKGSELLLMRLRDAITAMDNFPGEQVHRSWWIARDGVAQLERAGRAWRICLTNGKHAPIARESIRKLRASGFLPADHEE